MSTSNPQTPEEWEAFRFPARVRPKTGAPASEQAGRGEGGEEDEAAGGEETGGRGSADGLPAPEGWFYCAQTGFLKNLTLKKKVDLDHLNEAHKIVRLFAVFELRPDLAFDSLQAALEAASQARFGVSTEALLRRHSDGSAIVWKDHPMPTASSAGPHL